MKKILNNKQLFLGIILLTLSIVAFFFAFAPWMVKDDKVFNGFQVVFGSDISQESVTLLGTTTTTTSKWDFNFIGFLILFAPIMFSLLVMIPKQKAGIALMISISTAVLIFCAILSLVTTLTTTIESSSALIGTTTTMLNGAVAQYSNGWGVWVILGINSINLFLSLAAITVDKK